MAKVSLRNYNREIGTLIEQGQTEEAVGHCHHILKTFPKHLETYRLLGKAYLEARRYNDAADIFSRTIMSVPDDFVSHVGMSLIADEKEKHDEAIWHMERAFESQPSNAAVQGELQRLYGRRDGVEPPKVRMTSGALANVYMQGELYPQAIAEIMSVESRDPGRVDMQVLLSKAYFRSGQQVEASQIASDLLTKRPYCFDANRILVEVLPGTSRSESTQTYRHRINSLDPYAAFIKDSVFNIDDVPDAAVNLERLDWKPGSSPQLASGWGETLGIKLDQDEEEQPAWLKVSEDDSEFGSASASEEQADEENIPDFMRDAGWDSSSGAPEEESSIFDEPLSKEEEIAQGELPDWMKSMAPSDEELADVENLAGEEIDTGNDMVADKWMDDLLSGNAGKKPDESPKEDPIADMGFTEDQPSLEEEVDLPNWFGEDEETSVEEVVSTPGDEISPLAEIETSPDIADESLIADPSIGELGASSDDQDAALNWLEGLAANQGANPEELITDPNARTEDAPEWVQKAQDVGTGEPAADDPLAGMGFTEDQPSLEEEIDLPKWLLEEEETSVEEVVSTPGDEISPLAEIETSPDIADESLIADPSIGELGASSDDQDAALNWLEGLAANQGANPEELITDPNARTEDAPEWVQKAQDAGTGEPAAEDPLAGMGFTEDQPSLEEEIDLPKWLLEEEETSVEEVASTPGDEISPLAEIETSPDIADESLIADPSIGKLGASSEDQDAALNWLEGLAANQGAKPEELITDPNARTEDAPEWVQKAQDAGTGEPAGKDPIAGMGFTEDQSSFEEEIDLPKWLLEEEETSVEEVASTPGEKKTPLTEMEATPDIPDEALIADPSIGELGASSEDQDAALNWLEGLAANQGAKPEELITDPNARTEDAPEWVEQAKEVIDQESPEVISEAAPVEEEKQIPDLAAFGADEVESPQIDLPSDLDQESEVVETDDTIGWLKKIEVESELSEATAGEDVSENDEDFPAWLADMEGASTEDEKGPISDEDQPAWMKDEEETVAPTLQPTQKSEWQPIEEAPKADSPVMDIPPSEMVEPEVMEELSTALPPIEEKPVPAVASPKPQHKESQPQPKAKPLNKADLRDTVLESAQAAMQEGNISAALEKYGKLVKKKRLLDEVIHDLREATYEYPVDISILQMLGDAYIRAGRLQEGLDTYTKAEELLR